LNHHGRFLPGGIRKLARAIEAFGPDIFNGFSNVGSFYGVVLARRAHVPLVVSNVGTVIERYSLLTRISARLFLPRAHIVLVNSASLLTHYTEKWASLRGRVAVVPNVVDLAEFRAGDESTRAEVRSELGLSGDVFVAGHVGRFVPEKAQDDIVRAARFVQQSHWLLIGDGPCRPGVQRLAREQGVCERMRFLGARSDVSRLLHACDLFCLPSWFEGMPNALLESMAAGLPAVGTNVPGIVDLIQPGVNGWLVPPHDPAALAAAVSEAAASPERLREYGRNARDRVVSHHGPDAISLAFLAMCRKHLDARQPRHETGIYPWDSTTGPDDASR
jgi:glycosyltransferase involved in cell wall biosynthesis